MRFTSPLSDRRRTRSRLFEGTGLIRMRLWLAMLGLTVLPMVGAIFIVNTLTPEAPIAAEDRRAGRPPLPQPT